MNAMPYGSRHVAAALFMLMTLALPAPLRGQEARGRITGRVTDTSTSAIPGATVTVTDPARGSTVLATTNEQGLFQAPYLLPGTYRITVELQGFKKHVQDRIIVPVAETVDVPIVLEVGAMAETLTVVAEPPTVNTSNANLGLVVDQAKIASLPLIHGDPYKIMGLAPGLAHSGSQRLDRPYEPTHIVGYAYQGTRSNRSDLLIDGAPSTATANANEVIATYVPPSDLVQEFKVQTATFDAQFGNTEGGVTSISIKSGTNAFHGSAYYFAEPYKLGANDFFGKSRGQDIVESSSDRPGFTVGGPISVPGLYSGRDKTFFMFGFEHIKDVRPRFDAGGESWVPTDKLRNGDFSDYSSNITIYDPLTRVPVAGGQFTGQPFPGNVIPADRISPIARKILEYYSAPKNPGLVGNITDSTLPETADYNSLTGRVDQRLSASNRMFARYSWYNRDSIYNEYLDSVASGTWFQFQSWQFVVDDVHALNDSTVLNFRYAYNRFDRNSGQEEDARNYDLTSLGFPASYNSMVPEANRYFPRLDFDGTTMIDVASGADIRPITSHTVSATVNKSQGTHTWKAGAEMRLLRRAQRLDGQQPGRPVRVHQCLHAAEQHQQPGLPGSAELRVVPARVAGDHLDHPRRGVRRTLHDVGLLLPRRLARQQQADPQPRSALRGRDAAQRGGRPDGLQLRLRLRPADSGHRPEPVRGAQRPCAQGPRAAAQRPGRSDVRRSRHRRDLPDAEEFVAPARRLRLRSEPEDGRPRWRRPVRRLPRPAARRRHSAWLLADDDVQHHLQRQRRADPLRVGHRAPDDADSRAGRQHARPPDLARQRHHVLQSRSRRLQAAAVADRRPA